MIHAQRRQRNWRKIYCDLSFLFPAIFNAIVKPLCSFKTSVYSEEPGLAKFLLKQPKHELGTYPNVFRYEKISAFVEYGLQVFPQNFGFVSPDSVVSF